MSSAHFLFCDASRSCWHITTRLFWYVLLYELENRCLCGLCRYLLVSSVVVRSGCSIIYEGFNRHRPYPVSFSFFFFFDFGNAFYQHFFFFFFFRTTSNTRLVLSASARFPTTARVSLLVLSPLPLRTLVMPTRLPLDLTVLRLTMVPNSWRYALCPELSID